MKPLLIKPKVPNKGPQTKCPRTVCGSGKREEVPGGTKREVYQEVRRKMARFGSARL